MNTLPEIKFKILKSSNSDDVNFLISLRAFLIDHENCPWSLIKSLEDIEIALLFMQSKELDYFKQLNTRNIHSKNIKPLDIYRMPKNKRLILLDLLNDMLRDFLDNNIYLEDTIRINPFEDDSLLKIIFLNEKYINKSIKNLYCKRNEDAKKLLNTFSFKNNIYDCCYDLTFKIKLTNYWNQMWSESKNYNLQNNIIDKILINNTLLQ